jgi:FlaA1/EpsC-like NDP-sugar epimerase
MKNPKNLASPIFDAPTYFLVTGLSLSAAFGLRFDFALSPPLLALLWRGLLLAVLLKAPLFCAGRFRRSVGVYDLFRVLGWNILASALFAAASGVSIGSAFPRSVYLIDFCVCFQATVVVCFWNALPPQRRRRAHARTKSILIYGAGAAGVALLQEIRRNQSLDYEVAGFLDDDRSKQGAKIMGTRVLGPGREAAFIVERLNHARVRVRVEEIVIAIPSATAAEKRQALAHCRATHLRCKTMPAIADQLEREALVPQIQQVPMTDLLGRPMVELDQEPIAQSIEGHCVLVTGAGGSIGSELCRQVAQMEPRRLIALDQAESDLFRIQCELRDRHPHLDLVAALGDIRDPRRLADVFDRNPIDSVFHAAAYKHVPMMEAHVRQAVQNNILGTWNLVNAVWQRRIPRFLMISTDKAVNPTSVMGVTKRACELIVAAAPRIPGKTTCVSVRFGNVLGSNGSVVPIFQAQIAAGGPVCVTHPDIQRYFMTTSEAVSLVLQASSMGTDSEIFVLDMGEPVRIVDLAVNMIRLAGLEPYKDVDIRFTGLRPGEKLFEEINCSDELMLRTCHDKIRIFQQAPPEWTAVAAWLDRLRSLLGKRSEEAILNHLRELVPEYQTGEKVVPLRCAAA